MAGKVMTHSRKQSEQEHNADTHLVLVKSAEWLDEIGIIRTETKGITYLTTSLFSVDDATCLSMEEFIVWVANGILAHKNRNHAVFAAGNISRLEKDDVRHAKPTFGIMEKNGHLK